MKINLYITIIILFLLLIYIKLLNNYENFSIILGSIEYKDYSFDESQIDELLGNKEMNIEPLKIYKRIFKYGAPGVGATKQKVDYSFKPDELVEVLGNDVIKKKNDISFVNNISMIGKIFEILKVLYNDNIQLNKDLTNFKSQLYTIESDIMKLKQKKLK